MASLSRLWRDKLCLRRGRVKQSHGVLAKKTVNVNTIFNVAIKGILR
jgi:hypothetical protein